MTSEVTSQPSSLPELFALMDLDRLGYRWKFKGIGAWVVLFFYLLRYNE